jgi:hypothetical protein
MEALLSSRGWLSQFPLSCVAQVQDHGTYQVEVKPGVSVPSLFIVQELVSGDPLRNSMLKRYPRSLPG